MSQALRAVRWDACWEPVSDACARELVQLGRLRWRRARLGHELNIEVSPLGRLLGALWGHLTLDDSPLGRLSLESTSVLAMDRRDELPEHSIRGQPSRSVDERETTRET